MSAGRRRTVGIDVTAWINSRGFGRFTREIVSEIVRRDTTHRYVLFTDGEGAESGELPAGAERVVVSTSESPARAASARGHRRLRDVFRMSAAVRRTPLDLFFFPTHYTYFPLPLGLPAVVGVHDATTAIHPGLIFPTATSRVLWTLKERLALAQASAVVTVSESARREIVRCLRVPAPRVHVVPEGPSACFREQPLGREERARLAEIGAPVEAGYVLHVGGVSPHKNLLRLVRVFGRIARDARHAELRLVLAGDIAGDNFHSCVEEVRSLARSEGLGERVVLTGFVDDALLALLYGGASVLAFPSLHEGFGLPAVEAMACGTPVVASRAGSLPEVLGDAGILFDPESEEEMERSLRSVLDDPELRRRLRASGLARAKLYSWERAGAILVPIFRGLAAGRGAREGAPPVPEGGAA